MKNYQIATSNSYCSKYFNVEVDTQWREKFKFEYLYTVYKRIFLCLSFKLGNRGVKQKLVESTSIFRYLRIQILSFRVNEGLFLNLKLVELLRVCDTLP